MRVSLEACRTMSLKRIALRDFVIVRELELDFGSGFSVLTGETGAGKSILVDALQFVLGARADAVVVREGATRSEVSAEFDAGPVVEEWLAEAGFNADEALILRRSVDANGKSRGWINGSVATAAQLREVGAHLVDIHGQHAWQSLTRPEEVRSLLDRYAGVDTTELNRRWNHWRESDRALAAARTAQDTLQNERERLLWQVAELEKLSPGSDEWESLNTDHRRLANAQALLEAAQAALDNLEDEDRGAVRPLARALAILQSQEGVEPEFRDLSQILASSLSQMEEVARSLNAWLRQTDLDPQRLGELDARLSLWVSTARRYRRTPAELPTLLASWHVELSRLDAAVDLGALQTATSAALESYMQEAHRVSRMRAEAAPKLERAITSAMQGLGMQGGKFEVAVDRAEPGPRGVEQIHFLVAGHAGTSPRPVAKVASGGELSRIALAITVTTSQLGSAGTLIFDEVDSGVGGSVAETVGRLMKQLGRDRQVLTVTHLPQVAACADHHYVVLKKSDGVATESSVNTVLGEARVAEIARMLGGEHLSGTTLAHAKEMLAHGAPRGRR
jgi:DNA repair protein RecN (Recombination protein N)